MKLPSLLAAITLLGCGTAFAAEPPAAPSAVPVKHATLKSCNTEATARKLTGKERAQFVKDCRAGKTSH